jgi:hypothetical protein
VRRDSVGKKRKSGVSLKETFDASEVTKPVRNS